MTPEDFALAVRLLLLLVNSFKESKRDDLIFWQLLLLNEAWHRQELAAENDQLRMSLQAAVEAGNYHKEVAEDLRRRFE
jgi:hypothetical protein